MNKNEILKSIKNIIGQAHPAKPIFFEQANSAASEYFVISENLINFNGAATGEFRHGSITIDIIHYVKTTKFKNSEFYNEFNSGWEKLWKMFLQNNFTIAMANFNLGDLNSDGYRNYLTQVIFPYNIDFSEV